MPGHVIRLSAVLALAGLVAGCAGGGDPDLVALTAQGQGPDEFGILPNQPLQTPDNLSALPPPTPGGANRADQTPQADAVAALGGNPAATQGGRVEGPALMAQARRFGVDPGIRATLAAEDYAFRQRNSGLLLERLFNTTVYFRAYRGQTLDQYEELERLRARGVRTPAAPPENLR